MEVNEDEVMIIKYEDALNLSDIKRLIDRVKEYNKVIDNVKGRLSSIDDKYFQEDYIPCTPVDSGVQFKIGKSDLCKCLEREMKEVEIKKNSIMKRFIKGGIMVWVVCFMRMLLA